MTQKPDHNDFLASAASQVDLTMLTSAPAGITFENLRRRGIDISRMNWTIERPAKSRFFGKGLSETHTVMFLEKKMHFESTRSDSKIANEIEIFYEDVQSIEVLPQGGSRKTPMLNINTKTSNHQFGEELDIRQLTWMRDRIVLEAAGLVWRPLFNVGKRTTRATANPDEDFCKRWNGTSGKLINAFLEQALQKAAELKKALGKRDFDNARSAAHWMKSSSAAVGAMQLSELCQRLEIEIDTKDFARARNLGPHLDAEFEKVIARLMAAKKGQGWEEPAEKAAVTAPASSLPLPLAGVRVLLAEDSKVNQEVVRDCLEGAGCTLVVANNGAEAQRIYSEQPFDVILMDCQMPDIDGFETTRLIREIGHRAGRNPTPIIALTANALRDDRERCIAAGMNDYVSKPFDETELLSAIAQWLPEDGPMDAADESDASIADAEPNDADAAFEEAAAAYERECEATAAAASEEYVTAAEDAPGAQKVAVLEEFAPVDEHVSMSDEVEVPIVAAVSGEAAVTEQPAVAEDVLSEANEVAYEPEAFAEAEAVEAAEVVETAAEAETEANEPATVAVTEDGSSDDDEWIAVIH